MNIQQIEKAAIEFRNAIEACSSELGISFQSFPKGSCGDATDLLGTYLIENGLGNFSYFYGDVSSKVNNIWSSHAWLQLDELVVDITADQFPEISQKVMVCSKSEWHTTLNGKFSHIADYRLINAPSINLDAIYKKIISHITVLS